MRTQKKIPVETGEEKAGKDIEVVIELVVESSKNWEMRD